MGNLMWHSNCKVPANDTVKPVAIFPNPFKDELTFQLTDLPTPFTIRLVNMLGQVVLEQIVADNVFNLNTTALAAEVYIYFIYDGKKVYRTGKLVKI